MFAAPLTVSLTPQRVQLKSWRRMSDRAIVILKVFCVAPCLQRKLVGEQDEAGLPIESRSHRGEAIGAHMLPRAFDPVRKELERGDVGQILGIEPAGEIDSALERNRHRAPLAVEGGGVFRQSLLNGHG